MDCGAPEPRKAEGRSAVSATNGCNYCIASHTASARGRGTTRGEASWILEDNMPMRRMIENFGGKPYKTYRIYEKLIG